MTIENYIKQFLENRDYVFAGLIEDYMRNTLGTKGETTGRVLRFMHKDGLLDKDYVDIGHGKPNVRYRLHKELKQTALL